MAKVYSAPKEWGWDEVFDFDVNEDYEVYRKRVDAKLDEIEAKYQIVSFPVADGCAMYAVWKRKPLTLLHIPYSDGYHANPILLRGLNLKDVDAMAEREKRLKELFSVKAA